MIVSPRIIAGLFYAFTAPEAPIRFPGAPFLLSMALMGLCRAVFRGGRPRPAS